MEARPVPRGSRIYLVECYAPAGYKPEIESRLRGACSVTAELSGEGDIEYVGAVLMPVDDLIFYVIRARDLESVQRITNRSHLVGERIVESVLVGMDWTPTAAATPDPR